MSVLRFNTMHWTTGRIFLNHFAIEDAVGSLERLGISVEGDVR